jgi:hypothetical protein
MSSIFIVVMPPPDERPDDLVGPDCVARRFGCSESSVRQGKCGTGGIQPVSRSPWRAIRAQVEDEHRKYVEGARKPQAEPKSRRIGLVRRRPRTQAA